MPLMAKYIYADGVTPLTLVLLRNAFSFPALAPLAWLGKNSLKIPKSTLPSISVLALFGCCITPVLLFSSYNYIPSGTATVFHFVYPAAVVLAEIIFLKAKANPIGIISLILCVAGIFLFYTPGEPLNLLGSGAAILSGITYAVYIVLLASFKSKTISPTVFTFWVALICSIAMLIICAVSGQLALPRSTTGWLLSAVFALSVNIGGVFLFQRGTFLIGGQRASILSTFEPITSIVIGALIFMEPITRRTGIGAVLVISASILIAIGDAKSEKHTEKK